MANAPAVSEPASGLLGLQEAADRLGVHYMTAYRYVRTGRLPATRIGAEWWVDPADLRAAGVGTAVAGRTVTATRTASQAAAARRLEDRLVAGDEPGAWSIVEGRLGSGPNPTMSCWTGWVERCDPLARVGRPVTTRWTTSIGLRGWRRASWPGSEGVSPRGGPSGSVILGAPSRELHGLPTAMAANVLRGRGFEVVDLGADVPADAFGSAVSKTPGARAVAVGVTAGNHDRSVRAIVRAVHNVSPGLPVLVGGAGIAGEEHAARLGAAWSGRDARSLGEAIEGLGRAAP